jgi:hypothetical protein
MNAAFRKWLALLALGVAVFSATPAQAASSENLDIKVSVAAGKSISLSTGVYNFGALSANVSSVSAVAVEVTNASTGLIETYTIQGASATAAGGTDWVLSTSTGTNQYALAAQFSATRPADDDAQWSSDHLQFTPRTCSATDLGNGTEAESGYQVNPGEVRYLWFRIKTPGIVSDMLEHKATLTLAVL